MWQGPGGSTLPILGRDPIVDDELYISGVNGVAVVLHRGPTHFSPDGEHCCRRVNGDPAQRRCVTFSEC